MFLGLVDLLKVDNRLWLDGNRIETIMMEVKKEKDEYIEDLAEEVKSASPSSCFDCSFDTTSRSASLWGYAFMIQFLNLN